MFNYPGKYYEIIRSSFRNQELEIEFFKSFLPENGSLLDLGCGTGTILREMATLGYGGLGVDQSEQFIKYANEHAKDLANISFICSKMHQFETKKKFDLAISIFVSLNYTEYEEIPLIFRKVKTNLKPGGCFVIDIGHMLNFVESYQPYIIAKHSHENIFITRFITHTIKPHAAIWGHDETILVSNSGKFEMYHEHYDQQVLKVNELIYFLKESGFESFEQFGWWDKRKPTGSGHLIIVAKV
jgi:2-polyprenyl-3-methyl-5-hydroxy-6-metoxy-1,4-benzoquinol methylase